ncbi:MAG: TrpB-like pyridoxal phosphate-dependent enzyme [Eubacteriales bacterium]|nr:TrpB-like pyridoxal phosphate-dependent enzyme [Eubacteriales bacterium]
MKKEPYRVNLPESGMVDYWYNVRVDMKERHDPYLNPGTGKPLKKEELLPVFCAQSVEQEYNETDRHISIPGGVMDYYRTFRPSPLVRAFNLERELDTPAKIFFKFEGGNTSGSHKLNSAAAQAFFAKEQGLKGLATETGAGQWGTALSMACAFYGLDLTVFMVKISAQQKPYRREVMRTYGAEVIESPSPFTGVGKRMLARDPESGGSLGCAISEAVERAVSTSGVRYALGSVLNHVLLHQAVIGSEAKRAMEQLGEYPDVVIGCAGGGSNLGGILCEYMAERLSGKSKVRFVAAEPSSCPSLTRGKYAYDFCDMGHVTPLAKMYTLGSGFLPSPIHAGGLRYHGMSPVLSKLYHDGYIDKAVAVPQNAAFAAAKHFARAEGILPAPESAHAIAAAIDEAMAFKERGERGVILFNLSGTGYFDMAAYAAYNEGRLTDHIPSDGELEQGFAGLREIAANAGQESV